MTHSTSHLVYGFHAVAALLKRSPEQIKTVYCLEGRQDKRLKALCAALTQQGLTLDWRPRADLDALIQANHQGIIAQVAASAEVYDETFLKRRLKQQMDAGTSPFLLVLDGVTDPHNLGASIRSAEAAGVHYVVVPKDNAATLNGTTIKVACGAAAVLPLVRVTNLARTLQWLQQQGIWVVGTAGEAEARHYDIDLTGPLALVMGSEEKGLRRLTRQQCDYLVTIPMQGSVSSLNVSVAAGVCLFEALRQRL